MACSDAGLSLPLALLLGCYHAAMLGPWGFPTRDGLHGRLLAREPFEPSREMALVGPSSNRHPNNDRVTERRLGGA